MARRVQNIWGGRFRRWSGWLLVALELGLDLLLIRRRAARIAAAFGLTLCRLRGAMPRLRFRGP
jgi:hypothetical protein